MSKHFVKEGNSRVEKRLWEVHLPLVWSDSHLEKPRRNPKMGIPSPFHNDQLSLSHAARSSRNIKVEKTQFFPRRVRKVGETKDVTNNCNKVERGQR